jgi:hypothetical protein
VSEPFGGIIAGPGRTVMLNRLAFKMQIRIISIRLDFVVDLALRLVQFDPVDN